MQLTTATATAHCFRRYIKPVATLQYFFIGFISLTTDYGCPMKMLISNKYSKIRFINHFSFKKKTKCVVVNVWCVTSPKITARTNIAHTFCTYFVITRDTTHRMCAGKHFCNSPFGIFLFSSPFQFYLIQWNLVIRNILVIAKLFTNANCLLSSISTMSTI